MLWKERGHFYSLRPIIPAVVFFSIAHLCDLVVEHPNFQWPNFFHVTLASLKVLVIIGDVSDVIGMSFLIYGFIKIIKYQKEEEKHIQELETLLPLCSNCKKYRTDDGQWMPIEKYLIESGAPPLTHGICPECAKKLYGDVLNKPS